MTLNIRRQSAQRPILADNGPEDARRSSRRRRAQGRAFLPATGSSSGPLARYPRIAVKDNFDTTPSIMAHDGGRHTADYANDKPPKGRHLVARLARRLGRILLCKTNPRRICPGPASAAGTPWAARPANPYDTTSANQRAVPSGRLGGGLLGPQTSRSARSRHRYHGNSVRFLSLVAQCRWSEMVATQGLVSRAGIVPLTFLRANRGGPMCRQPSEDTAALLEGGRGR